MPGRVEGIFVTPEHGELPKPVESVRALAGRGLEGNRYLFDEDAPPGTALTLIAAEAVEALEREHGISLEPRATQTPPGPGIIDTPDEQPAQTPQPDRTHEDT